MAYCEYSAKLKEIFPEGAAPQELRDAAERVGFGGVYSGCRCRVLPKSTATVSDQGGSPIMDACRYIG